MHPRAGWLSDDAHALCQVTTDNRKKNEPFDCDVLIIGSGYGGAVAAARLSAATVKSDDGSRDLALKVWVVERGREYLPGMFPSRLADVPAHVRWSMQDGQVPRGNATALWDLRMGDDVNVVLGSGLGGGSLINAAVMERPEAQVWQSGWPKGINEQALAGAYEKAEKMLQAAEVPDGMNYGKLDALAHLGRGLADAPQVQRCKLAVSFSDTPTPGGVARKACNGCGDCATGCNWQAKNSLDTNYLALARRQGASLYCGVLARRIEKNAEDGAWLLHWTPTDPSLNWQDRSDQGDAAASGMVIRARRIIVAAGSLGSTELLQRSQSRRLRFSPLLGSKFSTNGDMIAAAVDIQLPFDTQIVADETMPAPITPDHPGRRVGPTITGMLRTGQGTGRFAVQEFAIPAPLKVVLSEVMGSMNMLHKLPRHDWTFHGVCDKGTDPLVFGDKALNRSMVYGLMGDDGAQGRLQLVQAPAPRQCPTAERPAGREKGADWDACIAVQWPEARRHPLFDAQFAAFSRAYGTSRRGRFIPNPLWRPLPDKLDQLVRGNGVRGPLTTVHPLGGCPMADNATQGVVDAMGQVFEPPRHADSVYTNIHDGLVVLDGAIVPRALGINPALTITALAEHAIDKLMSAWRLTIPQAATAAAPASSSAPEPIPTPVWAVPTPRPQVPATGIRIREQMAGTVDIRGQRYWGELQVRFSPIEDVVSFVRRLPRRTSFERVTLKLYPDRQDQEDAPQWHAQWAIKPQPIWSIELDGHADVMFRYPSWWLDRVWRSAWNIRKVEAPADSGMPFDAWRWFQRLATGLFRDPQACLERLGAKLHGVWIQLAMASNLGERRGIDYLMRVDRVSAPDCPIQPGDRFKGIKVIENSLAGNPWRQVSEMALHWMPVDEPRHRYRHLGRLSLDLRYFVRQRAALVALYSQSDMTQALADLGAMGLFFLRIMLKIQLLKFVPPSKQEQGRDTGERRPGELPGLLIERYDLRDKAKPHKVLLTRYHSQLESTQGVPVVLFHGLTASGSTFAHRSIQNNLVQYLCKLRRDVWVVELPTSIAFDKKDAQDLTFEDVLKAIPPAIDFIKLKTRHVKVDVMGHCIGAAMLCQALLTQEGLHQSIHSLVLSQVGPLLQMSPANQLRGYLASYLLQFIGNQTMDARPSFVPGGAASLGQTLLDAVLASLPYPERDREQELARRAIRAGRPDFRVVRHRSDAMLGQLFELTDDSPVAPGTLDALDDILGYTRLKTLAQVIHYARLSMLTQADGRNRTMSQASLDSRMDMPVLLLHGRRSGVFDWRGSLESHQWLSKVGKKRGQPWTGKTLRDEEKLHMGLGTRNELCVFEKFGHQDVLIGTRAPTIVFPVIGDFLSRQANMPEHREPVGKARSGRVASILPRLPWTGPILGWLRTASSRLDDEEVELAFKILPHPGHSQTRTVALVPMRRQGLRWVQDEANNKMRLLDMATWQFVLVDHLMGPMMQAQDDPLDEEELHAQAVRPDDPTGAFARLSNYLRHHELTVRLNPKEADGIHTALLVLTVHSDMPWRQSVPGPQTDATNTNVLHTMFMSATEKWEFRQETQWRSRAWLQVQRRTSKRFTSVRSVGLKHRVRSADRSEMQQTLTPPPSIEWQKLAGQIRACLSSDPIENVETGLIRLHPDVVAAKDIVVLPMDDGSESSVAPGEPCTPSLCLAFGSCQYPPGLLDQELAQESYRRLAARIDAPAPGGQPFPKPQLLLLLGDQVYVDETAGVFEPVTGVNALDPLYERSFNMPAFRSVTSRLPTYMLLDDHEVRNAWQPEANFKSLCREDLYALARYRWYQGCLNPWANRQAAYYGGPFSTVASPGGWPICLLDSRSKRDIRSPGTFDCAQIAASGDIDDTLAWLKDKQQHMGDCPKLIVISTALLPIERSVAPPYRDKREPSWASDGWAGYPMSRDRLLRGIVEQQIKGVVLLAGDSHLSMCGSFQVEAGGRSVEVRSIVSSALYSPWRFTNHTAADFILEGTVALSPPVGQSALHITCIGKVQVVEGNGFAVLNLQRTAAGYEMAVQFDMADGVVEGVFGASSAA